MDKENTKFAVITIVDNGEGAVLQVQKNKISDAELIGHIEILKASMLASAIKNSNERTSKEPEITLDGTEIPKFDKGTSTLDG